LARFAAFVGTRDDVEIIGATIAQHRSIGVETIIITDAGSTDGTLDIVAREAAKGDVWLMHAPLVPGRFRYDREIMLARSIGSDWALFLDADEFVLPITGSVHDIPELAEHDILSIERFDAAVTPETSASLPGPMGPADYDRLLVDAGSAEPDRWPKIMARPSAIARIHEGGHAVDVDPSGTWRQKIADDAIIYHLPTTTLARFEKKVANIRQLIQSDPQYFEAGLAYHWVKWVKLSDEGRLQEEYHRLLADTGRLAEMLAAGVVRSTAELLENRRWWRSSASGSVPR
jgi:glycosyltransferase involved in cell wall biosynthesis